MNSVYGKYFSQGQQPSALSVSSPLRQRNAELLQRAMQRVRQQPGMMAPNPMLGLLQRTQQVPSSAPTMSGADPAAAGPMIGGLPGFQQPLQPRYAATRNILDMQQAGLPNLAPFRPQAAPYIPPQLMQRGAGGAGMAQYPAWRPLTNILDRNAPRFTMYPQ